MRETGKLGCLPPPFDIATSSNCCCLVEESFWRGWRRHGSNIGCRRRELSRRGLLIQLYQRRRRWWLPKAKTNNNKQEWQQCTKSSMTKTGTTTPTPHKNNDINNNYYYDDDEGATMRAHRIRLSPPPMMTREDTTRWREYADPWWLMMTMIRADLCDDHHHSIVGGLQHGQNNAPTTSRYHPTRTTSQWNHTGSVSLSRHAAEKIQCRSRISSTFALCSQRTILIFYDRNSTRCVSQWNNNEVCVRMERHRKIFILSLPS